MSLNILLWHVNVEWLRSLNNVTFKASGQTRFPVSARPAFIIFVNSDADSFTPSRRRVSIIVMQSSPRLPCRLVWKNYRMVWRPDCENVEDIFIRFDRIHERDGRTDGRTPHDDIGRACVASCGKKRWFFYQHLALKSITIKGKEKVKERIVLREIHLRTTGRHLSMGSHSVICHPTEVTAPPSPQPGRLVLDLSTP